MKSLFLIPAAMLLLQVAHADAAENKLSLKADELKKENCTEEGKGGVSVADKTDAVVSIAYETADVANSAKAALKLFFKEKELAVAAFKMEVKDKVLTFTILKPFEGVEENERIYNIKNGDGCVYGFKLSKTAVDDSKTKDAYPTRAELLGLAAKKKYKIELNDLVAGTRSEKCCIDDSAPQCRGKMNIIEYDAKCNRLNATIYKKDTGKKPFQRNKPLRVCAGEPLTFRVVNVNPEAYKVEIDDSAEAFIFTATGPSAAIFNETFSVNAASTTKADALETDENYLRGGLLLLSENLTSFVRELQYACIHQHYKLIDAKIEARRRVDVYLESLGKGPGELPEQFMASHLNLKNKPDSLLSVSIKSLYNRLTASYYNLESFYPEVPRNKDLICYTFNIKARENTPYMDKVNKKIVTVYIVHEWKVDISSGFYFAPNLNTVNYASLTAYDTLKAKNGSDSVLKGKRYITDKSNKGEFGFNSLVHYSYKFSPTIAAGVHIGAGISLSDKLTPRYFGGVSALLGNDRGRLNINLGVAMGNVKEVNKKYEPGIDDPQSYIPASENIDYVSRFQTSYYVGLSYNLPLGFSNRKAEVPETKK